jgi:hypothetical protein
MATNNEKEYLHCRINQVMELLNQIVQEISKWEIELSQESEEG